MSSAVADPEVLVIGGGPAGLMAAIAAARAGAAALVIEGNRVLGGQYYQRLAEEFGHAPDSLPDHRARIDQYLDEARRLGVRFFTETYAWGVFPPRVVALYHIAERRTSYVRPAALVLATGAVEHVVPFQGWTSPRVVSAGGAQNLMKSQGIVPGRRAIVAGSGPFLLVVANQLSRAGATVLAVIEAASRATVWRFGLGLWRHPGRLSEAMGHMTALKRNRVPLRYGHAVVEARQADGDQLQVIIAPLDARGFPRPKGRRFLTADLLCVGCGFTPASELARLLGCAFRFDEAAATHLIQHDELMETTFPGVFVAGETAGVAGVFAAEAEGEIAGTAAAWRAGRIDRSVALSRTGPARTKRSGGRRFAAELARAYQLRAGLYDAISDATVICRCEEVDMAAVRQAVESGDTDVNAVKARTRCGMGMCQGRMCEQNIRWLVSRLTRRQLSDVGYYTARPPVKPLPLTALASEVPG